MNKIINWCPFSSLDDWTKGEYSIALDLLAKEAELILPFIESIDLQSLVKCHEEQSIESQISALCCVFSNIFTNYFYSEGISDSELSPALSNLFSESNITTITYLDIARIFRFALVDIMTIYILGKKDDYPNKNVYDLFSHIWVAHPELRIILKV